MKINKKRISRKFIHKCNKLIPVVNLIKYDYEDLLKSIKFNKAYNGHYKIDWDKFVQSCCYNPSLKKKYADMSKECKIESFIEEVTFKTFNTDELIKEKE